LIGKGEQEIDTTDLGVTHVVAAFAILTIMPLDLVSGEMLESALADAREEVLFSMLQGQAEGAVFGFVEPRLPGFRSEGGGGMLEG
jgi:hypothetical protein